LQTIKEEERAVEERMIIEHRRPFEMVCLKLIKEWDILRERERGAVRLFTNMNI
jgi:hypothetical protein